MTYGDKEWFEARERHQKRMDRIHFAAFVLVLFILVMKFCRIFYN